MSNKAFTLIEMIVAVAVFTLLVTAGSGIFLSSIKAQRQSLATQEVLDQSSYLMEYMSKALRMAKKDLTGLCITAKYNYEITHDGEGIKFLNYDNKCQEFFREEKRLKEIKDASENYLTSGNLQISSFNINLLGQDQPPTDYLQPRITILLDIKGREQSEIKIQTTISQRNPDVRK